MKLDNIDSQVPGMKNLSCTEVHALWVASWEAFVKAYEKARGLTVITPSVEGEEKPPANVGLAFPDPSAEAIQEALKKILKLQVHTRTLMGVKSRQDKKYLVEPPVDLEFEV